MEWIISFLLCVLIWFAIIAGFIGLVVAIEKIAEKTGMTGDEFMGAAFFIGCACLILGLTTVIIKDVLFSEPSTAPVQIEAE